MRRIISIKQIIDRAEKDGIDLRNLAVDEDEVVSVEDLDGEDDEE